MRNRIVVLLCVAVLSSANAAEILNALVADKAKKEDVVNIEITEKVFVKDTKNLGINLGGSSPWNPTLKKGASVNFESVRFRMCRYVWRDYTPEPDTEYSENEGMTECPWKSDYKEQGDWIQLAKEGTCTILSGKSKWKTVKLKDVKKINVRHDNKDWTPHRYFFDEKIERIPDGGGIMIENDRREIGQLDRPTNNHLTKNVEIVRDVHPNGFGYSSCKIKSGGILCFRNPGPLESGKTTIEVSFWAKSAGAKSLNLSLDQKTGPEKSVKLKSDWNKYVETFVVSPKKGEHWSCMSGAGGDVIVDDIEFIYKGGNNPTAFRDRYIDHMQFYKPGIVRSLQMGGDMKDLINPYLERYASAFRNTSRITSKMSYSKKAFNMHDFYTMCEYLEAEPWLCLPGVTLMADIDFFMEYIGGPAGTKGGDLRIAQGHTKPWTETLKAIHVEFGNEAWNYGGAWNGGGMNGPDYWNDLFGAIKASPYYKRNIICHAAGQAVNVYLNQKIMSWTPNADRISTAPYIKHRFSKEHLAPFVNNGKLDDNTLIRWLFSAHVLSSTKGYNFQTGNNALKAGMEQSVYEINHHMMATGGLINEKRKMQGSVAGGLSVCNSMMMLMKYNHTREQNLFTYGIDRGGPKRIHIWNSHIAKGTSGCKPIPLFLACAMANRIIGGDLVETVHSGENPVFTAKGAARRGEGTTEQKNLSELFSYAFTNGNQKSILIVNLGVEDSHPIELNFKNAPKNGKAKVFVYRGDNLTAANDNSNSPAVAELIEEEITDFKSGRRIMIEKHSMLGLVWEY